MAGTTEALSNSPCGFGIAWFMVSSVKTSRLIQDLRTRLVTLSFASGMPQGAELHFHAQDEGKQEISTRGLKKESTGDLHGRTNG
jgi:hypothetical protein